jgi:hypothetical protein
MKQTTHKRKVGRQVHETGCAGRRTSVTGRCVCGRIKKPEAEEALDLMRLEHPCMELDTGQVWLDASGSMPRLVASERI